MIDSVGKAFVIVHTGLSLAAMTLGILIYFEFIDWGRADPRAVLIVKDAKDPKKDEYQRIAAEYDKSVVLLEDAGLARDRVLPLVAPVQASLQQAESYFGVNHLAYVTEINRLLRDDAPKIDIKPLQGPGLEYDKAGPKLGRPVYGDKVDDVDASYKKYVTDLKKLQGDLAEIEVEISKLVKRNKEITAELSGRDEDTGLKVKYGLNELLDVEYRAYQQAKEERAYMKPQSATQLEQANIFAQRRATLEKTRDSLQKALDAKKKK